VQSTLLTKVTLLGVIPQMLFVVVVSLTLLEGESVGITVAFLGGLIQDFLLVGAITGLTALVYTMVAFGVGILRAYLPHQSVWTPVLVVAIASAVAEFGYAILSIIMGQNWISLSYTARIAGLVILYNTLLTPFVYPVVKNVADRVRPERVVRL
jgi:rod shape-determining protein MreD